MIYSVLKYKHFPSICISVICLDITRIKGSTLVCYFQSCFLALLLLSALRLMVNYWKGVFFSVYRLELLEKVGISFLLMQQDAM